MCRRLSSTPFALFSFEGADRSSATHTWPVGQAAKTAASHAANVGSIPARVTKKELHIGFSCVRAVKIAVGADCGEGPPVPIPNTAVKLTCAENTCLETGREDR